MQWAGGDQVVEQARRLQKGDEERHLTGRGDRCSRVPGDVDTAGEGVDRNRSIVGMFNQRLFTSGVTREKFVSLNHAPENASDSRERANSTAGFRMKRSPVRSALPRTESTSD